MRFACSSGWESGGKVNEFVREVLVLVDRRWRTCVIGMYENIDRMIRVCKKSLRSENIDNNHNNNININNNNIITTNIIINIIIIIISFI